MPRAKVNKLYRTFVKGLITEAGYLTYPEDASSGELNTILSRKGNRTRRLGIEYEDGFQMLDYTVEDNEAINEFVWKAVANVAGTNFLVLQQGTGIKFLNLEASPVSDSPLGFGLDLRDYAAPGASGTLIKQFHASFSSGEGYLFLVHPYVEPLLIQYDTATDTISITPIIVQIRDFEGVNDGLANDEEPSTLSQEHLYNLLNQGWISPGTTGVALPGTTNPSHIDPYSGSTETYSRTANNEEVY